MNRLLPRIFALILIPCLIGDPATAASIRQYSFDKPLANLTSPHHRDLYIEQAVVQALIIPFHVRERGLRSHIIQKIRFWYAESPFRTGTHEERAIKHAWWREPLLFGSITSATAAGLVASGLDALTAFTAGSVFTILVSQALHIIAGIRIYQSRRLFPSNSRAAQSQLLAQNVAWRLSYGFLAYSAWHSGNSLGALLLPVLAEAMAHLITQLLAREWNLASGYIDLDALARYVKRAPTAERNSWEAVHNPNTVVVAVTPANTGHYGNVHGSTLLRGPEGGSPAVTKAARILERGLTLLGEYRQLSAVKDGVDVLQKGQAVIFLEDSPAFFWRHNDDFVADAGLASRFGLPLDGTPLAGKMISFELLGRKTEIPAGQVERGLEVLAAFQQLYAAQRLLQHDSKTSLQKAVEFYEDLSTKSPEDAAALHAVLDSPYVDSENLLSTMLRRAGGPMPAPRLKAGGSAFIGWFKSLFKLITGRDVTPADRIPAYLVHEEADAKAEEVKRRQHWNQKWVAWFLSSRHFDSPVDLGKAHDILTNGQSKEVQAAQLLEQVDARQHYDKENEARNARRSLYRAFEEGHALTVSRYGRASYFLTLLAAASNFLVNLQGIESEVDDLKRILDRHFAATAAADPHNLLVRHLQERAAALDGYRTDLRILIQPGRQPTKAELRGALEHLRKGLYEFQDQSLKQIDEFAVQSNPDDALKGDLRSETVHLTTAMLDRADSLFQSLEQWPGERANFSVLIQRASPSGARALNHLRLGNDPFEGDEEHIAQVFREGGDMTYGSSDDVWFEVAQYWIESLPLFIHDHAATASDGRQFTKLVIEQEAMEKALRRLALRFKRNIDDVMDSEHVALARLHVARNWGVTRDKFAELQGAHADWTPEEVALQTMRYYMDQGNEKIAETVAGVAALIELTWRQKRQAVADLQVREDVLRGQALARIVQEEISDGNTVLGRLIQGLIHDEQSAPGLVAAALGEEDARLIESSSAFRLYKRRVALMAKDAPYMKRRKIPTWIILTTQAPGMSDAFAGHWVDEDMALYNLTSDVQYGGAVLEKEVQSILQRDEDRFVAIARRLLDEFQLDYEIDALMATGEYTTERQAVLSLLGKYAELAEEAARIYMLYEALPENQRHYDREPQAVLDYIGQHSVDLIPRAVQRVVDENAELRAMISKSREKGERLNLMEVPQYSGEIHKYIAVLAREEVIKSISDPQIARTILWYASPASEGSLPRVLRLRLASENGATTARREVLSRYWRYDDDGAVVPTSLRESGQKGQPLMFLLNDPLYAYDAAGANKKYNRGYGPSRVDLGKWERYTTEVLAQWIGPADHWAKDAMVDFYRLYNLNVRAFDDVKVGEQMKPYENSFMEAALAVSHLFMPILQKIGSGNFQRLAAETSRRNEVKVRVGGAGSDGFCQPKDIGFPPFVMTTVHDEIMSYAGETMNNWPGIQRVTERLTKIVRDAPLPEEAQRELLAMLPALAEEYAQAAEKSAESGSFLMTPKSYLPALAAVTAFAHIGLGKPEFDPARFTQALIGDWHGQALTILEDRIRFAPVHIVFLLRQAFAYLHQKNAESPEWQEAVVTLPGEYKPVSDARLSMGMQIFEYLAGTAGPLLSRFGPEGAAIARFALYGFDETDAVMAKMLALRLSNQERAELTPQEMANLSEFFPRVRGPRNVRVVSVFNLAADALLGYISNSEIRRHAAQVRALLSPYIKEDMIHANILSERLDLRTWVGLKHLSEAKLEELEAQIGQRLLALALDVRLNDPEYRNGKGSDVWESIRGGDVFSAIVHYPEMTGPEDEGVEAGQFGRVNRMMDDLPRVADTMRDGRAHSAAILLDAPVQGRKTAADAIAIKQWLALGGWYVSPALAPGDVEKFQNQMSEERRLMEALVAALKDRDFKAATAAYAGIQAIAPDRYQRAREEEEFAKDASQWWRGGGMNNWSVRHRYYSEAWAKAELKLPLQNLDLGTLTGLGLMHLLNGREEAEILSTLTGLQTALAEMKEKEEPTDTGARPFSAMESAEVVHLFIKPRYHAVPTGQTLVKGESISLKRRDVDVEHAAGRALANFKSRQQALALRQRVEGYKESHSQRSGLPFSGLADHAYNTLGDGRTPITAHSFGRFIGFTEGAAIRLINEIMPQGGEKTQMLARLAALCNQGRQPTEEAWVVFMGKGDDKGAMGSLALEADGDAAQLEKIAQLGGLFDVMLALMNTLEFQQMSPEQMAQVGESYVEHQVNEAVSMFFARTIYDHTSAYFPSWMHPAKSSIGFTDYDTVFGAWLGEGKPFTRDQVLELAAKNHRWLNAYLDHLMRTKTRLRTQSPELFADPLLGHYRDGHGVAPIGVDCQSFTPAELEWWSYTQKREIAFQEQQGDHIIGVFDDLDADEILDVQHRVTILSSAPSGRQHTEIAGQQVPDYNVEYPQEPVNLVLTRAYDYQDIAFERDGATVHDRMKLVPNGYMFFSEKEYVAARMKQLLDRGLSATPLEARRRATEEARTALVKQPKGIPVAVRFRQPLIVHFDMPFHGDKDYQEGGGDVVGLPTSQSWIHNLTPGYTKGEEHHIYKGTSLYPWEWRWYKRYQFDAAGKRLPKAEVVRRILHGYAEFAGLLLAEPFRIMTKPFRQSGGRGALPQQLRRVDGEIDVKIVAAFAEDLADQGTRDDQVVQKMISSTPYLWASSEMIEAVRDGLIKKGIPLPSGAPLFVYSRVTVVYVDGQPEFVLELVVSSRMAVSNVGLGGVLFKWQKTFASSAELAEELSLQRRVNAGPSMALIEKRAEAVQRQILEQSEELAKESPEMLLMAPRLEKAYKINGVPSDRTGWPYTRPRYIMHDLLEVPVVRMADGREIEQPDILDVKFDGQGRMNRFLILDPGEKTWKAVWVTPEQIIGWRSVKIEDNIGYGLWFPFVQDEEKREREAARRENRPLNPFHWGKELRVVLRSFAQAANGFKREIGRPVRGAPAAPTGGMPPPASLPPSAPLIRQPSVSRAVERARTRLAKPASELFSIDEVSVAFKEFILGWLLDGDLSRLPAWRERFIEDIPRHGADLRARIRSIQTEDSSRLIEELAVEGGVPAAALQLLWQDPGYLDSIAESVLNEFFTAGAAPELQIAPVMLGKAARKEILDGKQNHVLIFDNNLGITDEIYPLMIGAHISEMDQARPGHNVLAVRWDWVNKKDGTFRKAIVYIRKTGELKEVTFDTPIRPDGVQTLALARQEIPTHREISSLYARIGIAQVNADIDPSHSTFSNGSAAAQADSKWATWQALKDAVATPRVVRESSANSVPGALLLEALPAAGTHVQVRVQPDGGTEGDSQSVFQITPEERNALPSDHPLARAVQLLLDSGQDAVIRQEVGNVRYGPDHRRMTLRVNVSQSRSGQYHAESGYAQIGSPGSVTASSSRNGQIVDIEQALTQARYAGDANSAAPDWHTRVFDQSDLEKIKESAVLALQALNLKHSKDRQLFLAGIDVELEILPDGMLKAWVLDINPRPTGLRYANRLDQILGELPDAHVQPPLFAGLWAQRHAPWRTWFAWAGVGLFGILGIYSILALPSREQLQAITSSKEASAWPLAVLFATFVAGKVDLSRLGIFVASRVAWPELSWMRRQPGKSIIREGLRNGDIDQKALTDLYQGLRTRVLDVGETLQRYHAGFLIGAATKDDASEVTRGDLFAQVSLLEYLLDNGPQGAIVSRSRFLFEESLDTLVVNYPELAGRIRAVRERLDRHNAQYKESGWTIVIDPIDGTKQFAEFNTDNPLRDRWMCSVAVYYRGVPVLSVGYAPEFRLASAWPLQENGRAYHGTLVEAFLFNDSTLWNGQPLRVAHVNDLRDARISLEEWSRRGVRGGWGSIQPDWARQLTPAITLSLTETAMQSSWLSCALTAASGTFPAENLPSLFVFAGHKAVDIGGHYFIAKAGGISKGPEDRDSFPLLETALASANVRVQSFISGAARAAGQFVKAYQRSKRPAEERRIDVSPNPGAVNLAPAPPKRSPADELAWNTNVAWNRAMGMLTFPDPQRALSPTPRIQHQPWLANVPPLDRRRTGWTAAALLQDKKAAARHLENLAPLLIQNELKPQQNGYVSVRVFHRYPGRYEAKATTNHGFPLSVDQLVMAQKVAERAMEAVNLGFAPQDHVYAADLQIVPLFEGGRASPVFFVADIVSAQHEHAHEFSERQVPFFVREILEHGADVDHNALFALLQSRDVYAWVLDDLRQYLEINPHEGQEIIWLRQERALIMLGDLLWQMRDAGLHDPELAPHDWERLLKTVSQDAETRRNIDRVYRDVHVKFGSDDDYLSFINQFVRAANERELAFFRAAASKARAASQSHLSWQVPQGSKLVVRGPQRAGISSANAADNLTSANERGSPVLNFAINLKNAAGWFRLPTFLQKAAPPIRIELERTPESGIILETVDSLKPTRFPKAIRLTADNIGDFFTADGSKLFDKDDPLMLLKYPLIFSGIVGLTEQNAADYRARPQKILEDIAHLTHGGGLRIKLVNHGPSRSGFASSSSCSVALLDAFYRATGQTQLAEDPIQLANLALLLENDLGFKSGAQDVHGPALAGIKFYLYAAGQGLLKPIHPETGELGVARLLDAEETFHKNVAFIYSGQERPAASNNLSRGLNMRHLAYLSRDPSRFAAVRRSYGIHYAIVQAVEQGEWAVLADLFRTYMDYRRTVDPSASQSDFVDENGEEVLMKLFDIPRLLGLIHGGMFTGAMGGGVLMGVLTKKGERTTLGWDGWQPRFVNRFQAEMLRLKRQTIVVRRGQETPRIDRPFKDLRLIDFDINREGLTHRLERSSSWSLPSAVMAKAAAVLLALAGSFWALQHDGLLSRRQPAFEKLLAANA